MSNNNGVDGDVLKVLTLITLFTLFLVFVMVTAGAA